MFTPFHPGRAASALRVLLSVALLLQCAALFTVPPQGTHRDEHPLIATAIPVTVVPSGLRFISRQHSGANSFQSPSIADRVDTFQVPAAWPETGIPRPAGVSAPLSADFPRCSGRSPPAASA